MTTQTKIRLSQKQKEVIRLMREGYRADFERKDSATYRWVIYLEKRRNHNNYSIHNMVVAGKVVTSFLKHKLIELNGNDEFILTPIGQSINIE